MDITSLNYIKGKDFYYVEERGEGVLVFHSIVKDIEVMFAPNPVQSNKFCFNIMVIGQDENNLDVKFALNQCWIDIPPSEIDLHFKAQLRNQNKLS